MHGTICALGVSRVGGRIVCTDGGAEFAFFATKPGTDVLMVGDFVQFEPARAGLAQNVVLVWRPTVSPTHGVGAGLVPGNKTPRMEGGLHQANDRETCRCCGKAMTPTLAMEGGAPVRSVCPFCAAVYRDFRAPADPPQSRTKQFAAEGVWAGAVAAILVSLF